MKSSKSLCTDDVTFINMVFKKIPAPEVKLYGYRFIAFCNASVNFTAVSGDQVRFQCCCFVFSLLLFRENLESLVCLGTLEDKAPRYVMNSSLLFNMDEFLLCIPLIHLEARDQGQLCGDIQCLGQGQLSRGAVCHHSNVKGWRTMSTLAN